MSRKREQATASGGSLGERDQVEISYDSRRTFDGRLAELLKRAIKHGVQRFLRVSFAAIGRVAHEVLAPTASDPKGRLHPRRILVIRVDLLGDVVLSLPAVRALRRAYPEAEIDMLVLESTAGVLAGERDIDRVHIYDPNVWRRPLGLVKRKTWREAFVLLHALRSARYDLALSIGGDISSVLALLSGARRRSGYAAEAYRHFLTDTLPGGRYRVRQHEVRYVLDLAAAAGGIVEPGDDQLRLHVVPEAATYMAEVLELARSSTGAHGPIITVHPGARNGQAKRWPVEHIATLADQLVEKLDALVVLTGAPNEMPLARAVVRRSKRRLLDLSGKTSVPELVALLAASNLVISGDSGPMHIACAVKTPVVALHGPTDPVLSGPTAPDAIVLRHTLWCSPCYDASATAECRFGNPVCMKNLSPHLVFAAARRQLMRHGWKVVEPAKESAHVSLASHS